MKIDDYHDLQALSFSYKVVQPLTPVDELLNAIHQRLSNLREFSLQFRNNIDLLSIVFLLKLHPFNPSPVLPVVNNSRRLKSRTYHYLFQRFREVNHSKIGQVSREVR